MLAQGKDRQVGRTQARVSDQLDHVLQQMGIFPGAFSGDQHARQPMMGRSHQPALGIVHGRKDTETFLLQLPGDAPDPITGDGVGLDITVHDQDRELQVFVHGAWRPESDVLRVEAGSECRE